MTDRARAVGRLDGVTDLRIQITQGGPYLGQHYALIEKPLTTRDMVVEFVPGGEFCQVIDSTIVDVWVRDDQRWAIEEADLPLGSALEAARELLLLGHEIRLMPAEDEE